jgi:pyruvate kinase
MGRKAKIIATIGPSCQDSVILHELILAGVDVVRLNFSHGSHEEHRSVISTIRQLESKLNRSITVLQDIQGPKIRVGVIAESGIQLVKGSRIKIVYNQRSDDPSAIPIDYAGLFVKTQVGQKILLDDGKIELCIDEINQDNISAQVVIGGLLKSHKGVNFPGLELDLPGLTQKDQEDILFGVKHKVDAIAVSFVRRAEDIVTVRNLIKHQAPERHNIPLIAKLERPEALQNLEEIIRTADGVMVARGDLGVELSPEYVPIAQKRIIEMANHHGKFVITATQMLDSMIHNPRPTRAEATDIANAIFDGTDAVMLSGETAIGDFPVLTVQTMQRIIIEAERNIKKWGRFNLDPIPFSKDDDAFYITQAGYELAHDRNVAAIAIFTISGRTALLMSEARPEVDILAFTSNQAVYHYMNLYWGVQPCLVPYVDTIEDMLEVVDNLLLNSTRVNSGQQIVLICGYPVQDNVPANLTLLHTVKQN